LFERHPFLEQIRTKGIVLKGMDFETESRDGFMYNAQRSDILTWQHIIWNGIEPWRVWNSNPD